MKRAPRKKQLRIIVSLIIVLGIVFSVYFLSNLHSYTAQPTNGLSANAQKIRNTMRNEGVDKAFAQVKELYKTNPDFRSECHTVTHLIGEEAYVLFASNKKIPFGGEISHCGLGFYHGFMQELLLRTGNFSKAFEFCEFITTQNIKLNQKKQGNILGACLHGVGHGIAEIEIGKNDIHSMDQFLYTVIPICHELAKNDEYRMRCTSGVFNTLALVLGDPNYPFAKYDRLSAYEICRQLTNNEYIKRGCYQQMNSYVLEKQAKGNVESALKIASSIVEARYRNDAISGIMGFAAEKYVSAKLSFDRVQKICSSLSTPIEDECINGFVGGLMEFGEPGMEYLKASEYCYLYRGSKSEDTCLSFLAKTLPYSYSGESLIQACFTFAEKYRSYCEE